MSSSSYRHSLPPSLDIRTIPTGRKLIESAVQGGRHRTPSPAVSVSRHVLALGSTANRGCVPLEPSHSVSRLLLGKQIQRRQDIWVLDPSGL